MSKKSCQINNNINGAHTVDQSTYPRPSLTVDILTLRYHQSQLEILLIKRSKSPFKNDYALPGGFVDQGERSLDAAQRELKEETGVDVSDMIEVGIADRPDRDPRGWVVSTLFIALISNHTVVQAGDDAQDVQWFRLDQLPTLAFDHSDLIDQGMEKLRDLTLIGPRPLRLLKSPFRIRQVRELYSQLWNRPISPRAFKAWLRKRIAVSKVGPSRFKANQSFKQDW